MGYGRLLEQPQKKLDEFIQQIERSFEEFAQRNEKKFDEFTQHISKIFENLLCQAQREAVLKVYHSP